jgi:hypothetical protein
MALSALDMEQSSPSPPPGGAAAPPTGDGAAEHGSSSEAAAPKAHAPAKPPAASLLGISLKGKAAGPAKAGDLTRFFEIAHRQTKPAKPSEDSPSQAPTVAAAEAESTPPPLMADALPVETPIAEAPIEPTALEDAAPPAVTEVTISAEAPVASDAILEPSFPLLLAPPAVEDIVDATVPVPLETPPAPDWIKAASTDESAFTAEPTQPLSVALVPMEARTPAAGALETPASAIDAPAPEMPVPEASPATLEPAVERTEAPPALSPLAVAAPIEPASPASEPPPSSEPPPIAAAPVEPAPAAQPAPTPIAPVEPVPTPLSLPAEQHAPAFKELVDYWRSLRSGDDHPPAESIDRGLVTERWPGTLLIAYTPASQDPRGELRPGHVTRLGSASTETQNAVEAGSHSTEWMLEVARTALVNDEPVEEQQRLATIKGVAGFRMVALPLGPSRGLPTSVLCTLMPSQSAPRFGKRRIWL